MLLELGAPSPWPVYRVGEAVAEGIAILISPPTRSEPSIASWRERVLGAARPPFTHAEIVSAAHTTSELGWPIELVETRLTDGKQVLEHRLTALYFLLEWWGAVIFRAPQALEDHRARALPVLLGVRPRWSDSGVVALAQLFSD